MGVDTDIRKGLFDALEDAGILSISFPNVSFEGEKPYLRVNVLPAPTAPFAVTTTDIHEGFLQVDVVVKEGEGSIDAFDYVQRILDVFPRNTLITEGTTKIRIDQLGWPGLAIQQPDGFFIPVSIPYIVLN